jgi:hypothetical protein
MQVVGHECVANWGPQGLFEVHRAANVPALAPLLSDYHKGG